MNNVKHITEADGIRFDAQLIVSELPTIEELNELKDNVEACVNELTQGIGDAGFVYDHNSKKYTFFMVINGEEIGEDDFDIFDGDAVIETARFDTTGCNISATLKQLMKKSKKS